MVGGKTGADGRLFAYIVWTVPGGPAEKGGLQQGDKVRNGAGRARCITFNCVTCVRGRRFSSGTACR